jgi:hypothetical protein
MKKFEKIVLKCIGFGASLFLTICSGLFAMVALCALIMSIVNKDFVSVIGCVGAGLVSCILWSIRKDTLV